MVRSMTGFGRGESHQTDRRVSVEIRSVNHRFFDFGARMPSSLSILESRIRERTREAVTRGKVNIAVTIENGQAPLVPLRVNDAVARRYIQIAQQIRAQYGVRGELDLEDFLALPDLIERETVELEEDKAWEMVVGPLDTAIAEYQAMRTQEGSALAKDLSAHVTTIRAVVDRVEARVPDMLGAARTRLRDRIGQVCQDAEYNQQRLEAEIALFADRSDVTEECVRLRSHLDQFMACFDAPDPAGRRFTFLLQEMNREINTIGAKSQDLAISQDVILAKEEVEKIREQVQNVE
jgi:uncharacterized protein (TIGR00255 family)